MQADEKSKAEIRRAIVVGFPASQAADLGLAVNEASIGKTWQNLTYNVQGGYDSSVDVVVRFAIARGQLTTLLETLAKYNRSIGPALNELALQVQPLNDHATSFGIATRELESMVLDDVEFRDVGIWLERLGNVRRAVCRIEPQPETTSKKGFGTGFLVAHDVVMTCNHVADSFWNEPKAQERVILRFDYETQSDGSIESGEEFKLADDWKIYSTAVPDVALIRVQPKTLPTIRPRIPLPISDSTVREDRPLLILQHPNGDPLKLQFGEIDTIDGDKITYKINTKGGSSGSPCLGSDLQAIAIHFATGNCAYTMKSICTKLKGEIHDQTHPDCNRPILKHLVASANQPGLDVSAEAGIRTQQPVVEPGPEPQQNFAQRIFGALWSILFLIAAIVGLSVLGIFTFHLVFGKPDLNKTLTRYHDVFVANVGKSLVNATMEGQNENVFLPEEFVHQILFEATRAGRDEDTLDYESHTFHARSARIADIIDKEISEGRFSEGMDAFDKIESPNPNESLPTWIQGQQKYVSVITINGVKLRRSNRWWLIFAGVNRTLSDRKVQKHLKKFFGGTSETESKSDPHVSARKKLLSDETATTEIRNVIETELGNQLYFCDQVLRQAIYRWQNKKTYDKRRFQGEYDSVVFESVKEAVNSATASVPIRIVSWNVELGKSCGADPEAIISKLKSFDCAIIALSEVSKKEHGDLIARSFSNYEAHWGKSGGENNLVTLVDPKLVRIWQYEELKWQFEGIDTTKHRLPQYFQFRIRETLYDFRFVNNNFSDRDTKLRASQISQFRRSFHSDLDRPFVALGTFYFDRVTTQQFKDDRIIRLIPKPDISTHYDKKNETYEFADHVFISEGAFPSRNITATVSNEDLPDDHKTSDHRPIIATIVPGNLVLRGSKPTVELVEWIETEHSYWKAKKCPNSEYRFLWHRYSPVLKISRPDLIDSMKFLSKKDSVIETREVTAEEINLIIQNQGNAEIVWFREHETGVQFEKPCEEPYVREINKTRYRPAHRNTEALWDHEIRIVTVSGEQIKIPLDHFEDGKTVVAK